MEGTKPCIFLELCAGSAKLSAAVRSTGISVVPIDHKHNRHAPRCKLVQLDLAQPHAWNQILFLLDNYIVVACHIAPPCGTCSRARGIPMADGSPGPQPLRSDSEPMGIKGLSYVDQMRVDGANALYDVLGKLIEELHKRNIPWSIENPTNSLLWELRFFLFAVVHGEWIHCHACAFGGTRKKLTTFFWSAMQPHFNRWRGCAQVIMNTNHGVTITMPASSTLLRRRSTLKGCAQSMQTSCNTSYKAGVSIPMTSWPSPMPRLHKHKSAAGVSPS